MHIQQIERRKTHQCHFLLLQDYPYPIHCCCCYHNVCTSSVLSKNKSKEKPKKKKIIQYQENNCERDWESKRWATLVNYYYSGLSKFLRPCSQLSVPRHIWYVCMYPLKLLLYIVLYILYMYISIETWLRLVLWVIDDCINHRTHNNLYPQPHLTNNTIHPSLICKQNS